MFFLFSKKIPAFLNPLSYTASLILAVRLLNNFQNCLHLGRSIKIITCKLAYFDAFNLPLISWQVFNPAKKEVALS